MTKKYIMDLIVDENIMLHPRYCLLKLTSDQNLPEMNPGQFVEVKVDKSANTFLRRPISINYIDRKANTLWLLVQLVGEATRKLSEYKKGESLNVMLPLGNGYSIVTPKQKNNVLLVGGGVGTAPLLYLGERLCNQGLRPTFLVGARTKEDLLLLEKYQKFGDVYLTTEDGSAGEKGFVTQHSILNTNVYDMIYVCGPKPMMMAVAKYAKSNNIECEVSLENTMACGLGACLCCVEKTQEGHVCVCSQGPVFNINQLTW